MNDSSTKKNLKLLLGFSMSAWINGIINFILMPIITRIVDPSDLGQIDMFITFCNMFVYASTLGMHQAYMRFFNENIEGANESNLFALAIKYSTVGAVIAAIICALFKNVFSKSIIGEFNPLISILMAAYIFFTGFIAIGKTKPRMYGSVMEYTTLVVAESLTVKMAYLSAAFSGGVTGSICLLVTLVAILMLICFFRNKNDIFISTKKITKEFKITILKYALPTVPVMFIANVNTSVPKIYLNRYYNSSTIGIYSSCLTLVSIITLIQAGINVFWGPYVFENYKKNQSQIQAVHRGITFAIVFCGLGLILTQDIIYYILGDAYRESKEFYGFLLASPIFYTIGETVGIGINIQKKTYWNIIITSITLFSTLVLCQCLVPIIGNIGAAIAVMVSSMIMLLVKAWIGEKYYTILKRPLKTIIPVVLYCVAACLSSALAGQNLIRMVSILLIMLIIVLVYYKDIVMLSKQLKSMNNDY